MALEAPTTPSFYSPWPDRLRHSAIILLAAAFALSVVVVLGELSALHASAVFACIAAAALVPWRLHNAVASREDVRSVNPVEAAVVKVRELIGWSPDLGIPSVGPGPVDALVAAPASH